MHSSYGWMNIITNGKFVLTIHFMSFFYNKTKLHLQNTIVLYNYNWIYKDSIYRTLINWIKSKNTPCTHFSSFFFNISYFFVEIVHCILLQSSDLNSPDAIISTFQLINTNFPPGLKHITSSPKNELISISFSPHFFCAVKLQKWP